MVSAPARHRIARLTIDDHPIVGESRILADEREIAINDLLARNFFAPVGSPRGAYHLRLRENEGYVIIDVDYASGKHCQRIALSMLPFRSVVRDYFAIIETYESAIRGASRQRIETLDMARRGIHDEGARLLTQRIAAKAEIDFATARRLFTLLCILSARVDR